MPKLRSQVNLLLTEPYLPPGVGGTLCPPCHEGKYMYERVEKTFPNYEFGKGQYTFYRIKLSRFAEKQTESNAFRPIFFLKSQTLFWRVLGIQTS